MAYGSYEGFANSPSWLSPDGNYFPNPWDDIASLAMPETIQHALRWCEYVVMSQGMYFQAINRLLSYFITDIDVTGVGDDEKEKWRSFYNDDIDYRKTLSVAGRDAMVYGNGFISVLAPFSRSLACKRERCGAEAPLRVVYNHREYDFKWNGFDFHATCPICKYSGPFRRVDRRMINANDQIIIKRWNPHDMEIVYDPWTEQCEYVWKIPDDYCRMVREGRLFILERVPWEVVEAIKKKDYFRFEPGNIFHMKEDALAGIHNRGWGISRVLTNFRQSFHVQVLRRYNEAVALDYVIPFRVITPEPGDKQAGTDPLTNLNMGDVAAQIRGMIRRRQRDPASWNVLPFPVRYSAMGGDARALAPVDLLNQANESLLNDIGMPVDLYKGTLQLQTSAPSLRVFEAMWSGLPHNLNGLLRYITDQVSRILGWQRPFSRLTRVTHADDLTRQQAKLQLMLGGQVSQSTGLESVGLQFRDETEKMLDDQKFQAEAQARTQKELQQAGQASQLLSAQGQQPGGAPGQPGGQSPAQGQPQQPGNPQDPMQQAGQSAVANMAMNDSESITPPELWQRAQTLANDLMAKGPTQRQSELRKLKQINPTLHPLVLQIMDGLRQSAATQGKAQVLQQRFGAGAA